MAEMKFNRNGQHELMLMSIGGMSKKRTRQRLERVSVAECEMAMCAMIEYIAQWCEINVMESSHPGMHVMMMAPMVTEFKRLKKEQSQEGMPQVAMRTYKEHGTGMPLEMEVNVERNCEKGTRLRRCWKKGGIMVAP